MKRIISITLSVIVLAICLTGCGKNDRLLYKKSLKGNVTLGKYEKLEVDTSSDEYKSYYNNIVSTDAETNYVIKSEGTVSEGDTANIDYTGKKDGVAFDGGTAQGYDLKIGSNSFIEGFESGLIGKTIGDTVDLNLTFPESYGNSDLAGKAVVFTVKINYVKSPGKPEDYYKTMKFDSVKDYEKNASKRAAKLYLADKLINESKVSNRPSDEADKLCERIIDSYRLSCTKSGTTLETLLSSNNMTLETFKTQITENILPTLMDRQMIMYAVFDAEKLKMNESVVEQYSKIAAENSIDNYNSLANSGLNAFSTFIACNEIYESYAVEDAVCDYLYDNAKIK